MQLSLRRRSGIAAILAATFLALLVIAAVFAPLLAPYDPNQGDLAAVFRRPSGSHLLGTDRLGRDLLSRLLFGARTSLFAASESVGISIVVGVPAGLVAGHFGGRLDAVLNRINEGLMTVPALIFALAIVAALGPGLGQVMIAIGIVFIPRVFRVVRASALEVSQRTFIEAARSIGCSRRRIVALHVFPNTVSPLLVVIAVSLGSAVLAESTLSYLGLGSKPPTASWGGMIADAAQKPDLSYLLYPPGIALLLTIACFVILGDAVGAGRERNASRDV